MYFLNYGATNEFAYTIISYKHKYILHSVV